MVKFWNWLKNEETEERILELNGVIAEESWFDDEVTPKIFKEELMSGSGPVTLWINSPGGDCVAASQIYTMLMDYKGEITIKVDGIAASAASVIAMAGTKVLMSPTALMMIHNPSTCAYGDHSEMQKAIELLDEVKESIVNAYEIKTGMSRAKISRLMEEETWMNANKAVELGFADGLIEDDKKKAKPNDILFAFSEKTAATNLCNKISEKFVPVKPKAPAGRSVDDLRQRLDEIKKYI